MNAITSIAQAMVEESCRRNGKTTLTYRQALTILHDPGHSLDERILAEQFGT